MGIGQNGRRTKVTSRADKTTSSKPSGSCEPGAFQKISDAERDQLRKWTRRRSSPHRLVIRSRIVLLAAEGMSVAATAAKLQVAAATVRLWKQRFTHGGLAALTTEAPGRGRRSGTSLAVTIAVLEATRSIPRHDLTVRRVAAQVRTSPSTVWRVWRRHALGSGPSSDSIERVLRNVISGTG
jgi:transposase